MKRYFCLIACSIVLYACSNNQEKSTDHSDAAMESTTGEEKKFSAEMVVNKTDFICGMPVTAGISDTCHVDGKAYGFCSSECMTEFKKDPSQYIASK